MKTTRSSTLLLAALVLVGFPSRAEAYLDPSTGSVVLQVVIGSVLAGIAGTKIWWHKIRAVLRRSPNAEGQSKTT